MECEVMPELSKAMMQVLKATLSERRKHPHQGKFKLITQSIPPVLIGLLNKLKCSIRFGIDLG